MTRKLRRAIIVTQFFAPEPCAAAHRMEAMAHALRARGIDVTVVAPMPSFPAGRVDRTYRGKFFARERLGGIEIVRLLHVATARRNGRMLAWLSFAVLSTLYSVLFAKRADVAIISSPPITLALPGLALRFLRGSALIVDVRDVFPDLPIQMGLWKEHGRMARFVGRLVDVLYAAASLVVAVTPTALERVRSRVRETATMLAPNGCDRVEMKQGVIQRRNGEFVATFTGNMGLANGLDLLLDAAKLLKDDDVSIAMIGGGADRDHVAARICAERIANVDLYGVLSRPQAVGALAESDAALVLLRGGINESVPTKLYDAFSVGCPVVLSASGEARRVVADAAGGICSAPDDAESLADALRRLAEDRALARALGRAGQRFAQTAYDRDTIMADLAERIDDLAVTARNPQCSPIAQP